MDEEACLWEQGLIWLFGLGDGGGCGGWDGNGRALKGYEL